MMLHEGPPNGRGDLDQISVEMAAGDFGENQETLFLVELRGERRGAARSKARVALLHRPLDVLRVVVEPPNDDQVLATSRDEELSLPEEPEVSRPEERSLSRIQTGFKDVLRQIRPIPIALR